MKYSLKAKLSFSYVIVALISILLISVLTNQFLEKQFGEYIQQNQEQKNHAVAAAVKQQYLMGETWNYAAVETIGVNSLENGLIIKVMDISGKVIWDAQVHNHGLCQRIIRKMSQTMSVHYPNLKGGYVVKPYSIIINNKEVGRVEIGYYGPFYLTKNDELFINTLNKLILSAGVIAMVFALVLGFLMAKRLSNPISRVIDTTQMISRGDFSGRIRAKSNTKEICQLTEAVNDLVETLESQDLLRKRLTADVAHELRTPLATLRSHLEAMIDGIWKADADRLKSCHEEIMRIARMVGDLEMLARYDSDSLVLDKTPIDIAELARHVVKNFESDYIKKGVTLTLTAKEELIIADRDKINQVISNLLSNALKYTSPDGMVNMTVKGTAESVEIIVKDNGIGISSDDLPYIFERFYRADKSRTRLTGGSGIGLTIVRSIMEAHKGRIEVNSKLNEGSEVKVILPKQTL